MAGNKNLNSAAKAKKDEFYTQIADIENELWHYQKFFEGKTVLCNCDDPYESDFFKYFMIYFNQLKLRKVIATCYAGSPIVQTELDFFGTQNYNPHFDKRTQAIKLEVTEVTDLNGDGAADLADVKLLLENNRNVVTYLEGNGDFRSPECVDALKEADIVVTNPPFSLFREYVAQLIAYDKKFLIIGNMNAITYKEIFPLIKDNKLWLGYGFQRDPHFRVPDDYEERATRFWIDERGQKWRSFGNMHWFTNLDVRKRHEDILLFKRYAEEPELFPRYDNYDAIEVPKTAFIPVDYFGVMGVPITFLDKYNPTQFEIVGCTYSYGDFGGHKDGTSWGAKIDGKDIYKRLFIRRRRQ
ncbi:MAG: adenine-specific methyltransferase EcoRI family protein [Selenomonadaceae bacterium]|nr:adenine-specific methyltransferase EcoRI family protein [Selenomonadaceae bacterium]